jgi:hypothetical protein
MQENVGNNTFANDGKVEFEKSASVTCICAAGIYNFKIILLKNSKPTIIYGSLKFVLKKGA